MEVRRTSLVKPTLTTCFHIDFDWWKKSDRDWRIYMQNYLCQDHQKLFGAGDELVLVDWIDPETAEVTRVDGLQSILMSHCARQDEFITSHTALVDAVFRTFLANGNQPLNVEQLSEVLGRPPITILKTISGGRVMQGIRPCN